MALAPYGEPHELARASPAAFPEADLEFYDRARAAFKRRSYRWLADVEDLTLTRIYALTGHSCGCSSTPAA